VGNTIYEERTHLPSLFVGAPDYRVMTKTCGTKERGGLSLLKKTPSCKNNSSYVMRGGEHE